MGWWINYLKLAISTATITICWLAEFLWVTGGVSHWVVFAVCTMPILMIATVLLGFWYYIVIKDILLEGV